MQDLGLLLLVLHLVGTLEAASESTWSFEPEVLLHVVFAVCHVLTPRTFDAVLRAAFVALEKNLDPVVEVDPILRRRRRKVRSLKRKKKKKRKKKPSL